MTAILADGQVPGPVPGAGIAEFKQVAQAMPAPLWRPTRDLVPMRARSRGCVLRPAVDPPLLDRPLHRLLHGAESSGARSARRLQGMAGLPVTLAGRALVALRGELAGRGVRADAMVLARWHGQLWPAGGPVVGCSAGLFWWPVGRVSRDGRPIYAIHDVRDPAGAARRLDGAALMAAQGATPRSPGDVGRSRP